MDKKLNTGVNYAEIEQYRLPIYNPRSKEKVVTYYILDPESVLDGNPRMKRMRKKFCSIKEKKTRDYEAKRFCEEVTKKLRQGWNPLMSDSSSKSFASIDDVFKRYTLYIYKSRKENQLTEKTFVDYSSRLRMFQQYINEYEPICYVYQINQSYIEDYLSYLYVERDNSPRTRNNHLTWLSSFCNWMVGHAYLTENPCSKISNLRNGDKKRKCISHEDLARLSQYLEENNLFFLLACQFHYYTLIRPIEMTKVRVGDINVENQTVFVSHNDSKNHRDGMMTLPTVLMKQLIKLGVLSYPSDYYLFGKNFHPSKDKADSRIFREYWVKVRSALHFPNEYQFYSLKDTGITDSIDINGIIVTKDQARHQDVQTTNKYVGRDQLRAHPELIDYEGYL